VTIGHKIHKISQTGLPLPDCSPKERPALLRDPRVGASPSLPVKKESWLSLDEI
jgi:hypothetical protein